MMMSYINSLSGQFTVKVYFETLCCFKKYVLIYMLYLTKQGTVVSLDLPLNFQAKSEVKRYKNRREQAHKYILICLENDNGQLCRLI